MYSKATEARQKAWKNLQGLIKDVETAMLTTVSSEDFLRSPYGRVAVGGGRCAVVLY